ncbi:MAG: hypothetical protein SPI36_03380 [Candidatus Onthovivens sp.]|nr:hypothetical protein [Candidatus Onthovivens sp.]MDY6058272.1 hypothetical protein [Candidatus Onthovivens sp.]
MTSKECLERIIFEAKLDKPIFSVYYQELIEARGKIEKDLEILDILKNESDSKRIIERDGIVSFHLDMILTTDNVNKIKEWLEE